MNCSAAEMVFGTTLALPSDIVSPSDDDSLMDPSDYVDRLRQYMTNLRPALTRTPPYRNQIHPDLHTCTHVWIRIDAVRAPLQPHYNGPYQVIERHDKFFILLVRGKRSTISLDRLKPAYLDDEFTTVAKPSAPSRRIDKAKPTTPTTPDLPATSTPTRPVENAKPPPTRVTRSGRHVHWPSRYVEVIVID
ncbi:uncharacterized protein [Apostichopus japonicus]